MKCIAFIFARGGSKGVPGKNIKMIAGKPLIAHSIIKAKESKYIEKVIVSTDDEEIAKVAREFGAEVPFIRPNDLATDTSSEWLSWQHAVDFVEKNETFDLFVSVPATSPLRSVEDIDKCIESLAKDVDVVVTVKKAGNNPYFNMLKRCENGDSELVIKSDERIVRRQDAPSVYDMTTVCYVTRPGFIKEKTHIFDAKKMVSVVVPEHRAVDIDTPFDFLLAEALFESELYVE